MRIAEVIGTLTLSRAHPSLAQASFRVAVPMSLAELRGARPLKGESLVVYDEIGSGHGSWIALSESTEAAQPFFPENKPIDAYAAAILDSLYLPPATEPAT